MTPDIHGRISMSKTSDVGISPVLLQAISQSLNSSKNRPLDSSARMSSPVVPTNGKGASSQVDFMAKIIKEEQEKERKEEEARPTDSSEAFKTMLKLQVASALSNIPVESGSASEGKMGTLASDLAMANVLTALASQTSRDLNTVTLDTGQTTKTNVQQIEATKQTKAPKSSGLIHKSSTETNYTVIKGESESSDLKPVMFNVLLPNSSASSTETAAEMSPELHASPESDKQSTASNQASASEENETVKSSVKSKSDNPFVLAFNPVAGTSSDPNIIDMSSANTVRIIEHNGKRYIIQMQDIEKDKNTSASGGDSDDQLVRYNTGQDIQESDGSPYTNVVEQEVVTVGQQQESTTSAILGQTFKPNMAAMNGTPCPVCGDNVSGFHYGIFTCESCKGFFKRTVQNKKTFVCPRQGECEITLENRKKCPACRFAKCLVMGMKLEAIRHDRTRGGRSSYGGSSPFEEPKKKRPIKIIQPRRPSNPPSGESTLVSVLSGNSQNNDGPFVPQILTDIMNLESLMCDDDIPANISVDDFSLSNPNVFMTLLQLCELKLYKIVRWARNLPYFANISTDDQILLLQNCWCELLALSMCWKSIHLSNEIIFFHGQAIDQEKADMLNLSEMFVKMLAVVEQFKRLKLDHYECVAMKVIILICPDIKGLSEDNRLAEQQQKVSMALEQYISSQYPQTPCKYGEILLRLPELSRISSMMKDQLVNWMPSNTTSCGLLYELLKGENMKDLI